MAGMPHQEQRIGNLPYLNIAHGESQEIQGDARRFPVSDQYRTTKGRGFPGFALRIVALAGRVSGCGREFCFQEGGEKTKAMQGTEEASAVFG
jgi:hypothetical protein